MGNLREEAREWLTLALSGCYSKDGSICKLHTVFQPQKAINIILDSPSLASYFREGYVKLDEETKPIVHFCQVCEYFSTGEDEDGEFAQCSSKFEGGCHGRHWTLRANFKKVVSDV